MTCPHDRKRLAEGGYIRTWKWIDDDVETPIARFGGLEDFSDDGDCVYWLECATCLERLPLPDDWQWD